MINLLSEWISDVTVACAIHTICHWGLLCAELAIWRKRRKKVELENIHFGGWGLECGIGVDVGLVFWCLMSEALIKSFTCQRSELISRTLSSSHLFLINPTAARALTKLNCKKPPFYTLSKAAAKKQQATRLSHKVDVSPVSWALVQTTSMSSESFYFILEPREWVDLCEMLCELQPRAFVPHKSRFFNFCLSTLLLLSFFPPQFPPRRFSFCLSCELVGRKRRQKSEGRSERKKVLRRKFIGVKRNQSFCCRFWSTNWDTLYFIVEEKRKNQE